MKKNDRVIQENSINRLRKDKNLSLRTIDLFAGCGGLTLGLHLSGHELVFAIEKDPMAFETFEANFLSKNAPYYNGINWPTWLPAKNHDIQLLLNDKQMRSSLKELRGTIDLICGGPPCQGFSVGGLRDGKDARNQMPQRYVEFVSVVKPTFVLLENVEGSRAKRAKARHHLH